MTSQIIPVDPDNARTLARYANEIRTLRKRASSDIVEIGRKLIESKKLVGHGNWLSWLEREFQWTDDTALNYMRVHDLVKNRNFRDLSIIPVSGLFLLAAPSTPEVARQEATSRAEAGEPITLNTVKEIVGRAKQDDRRDAQAERKTETREPPMWVAVDGAPGYSWLMNEIAAVEGHLVYAAQTMLNLKSKMSEFERNKSSKRFQEIAARASSCAAILKSEGNPK